MPEINNPSIETPNMNYNIETPVMPEVNTPSIEMPQMGPVVPNLTTQPVEMPQVMDNQNMTVNQPMIGNTSDLNAAMNQINYNQSTIADPSMGTSIDAVKHGKKWPLTLRETILVSIALIGVIVVIIMYAGH